MTRLRTVAAKLRGLANRRRLERELKLELASHLDEATADFEKQGLAPDEARRAALRSFGGVSQAVESHRDARGWPSADSLLRDARRAVRLIRRSPAVAAAAMLSLGLGMGGTTTMFSLLNGLMLRPLPVRDPDRLVLITAGDEHNSWKMPVWEHLRSRSDVFDGLFAWDRRPVDLSERGESQTAGALLVSGSFFEVLGLQPAVGRLIDRSDDVQGGGRNGPMAVISHAFWQRYFAGAPDVVGRLLRINGTAFQIAGVTPRGFLGPEVGLSFEVALPLSIAPLLEPESPPNQALGNLWLTFMGRLKSGQDAAGATAALHAVMPAVLEAAYDPLPSYMRPPGMAATLGKPRVEPAPGGPSLLRERYDRPVATVTAIALVVLAIACVNLAHLFLARGEGRRRELAIAMALGATRARLVRQLAIEGLVLAAAGSLIGLAIAFWAAPVLIRELSPLGSATVDLHLDWRMLAFAATVAITTAFCFSLAPALRVTRFGLSVPTAFGSAHHAPRHSRLTSTLMAVQVGLALVMTVSATLLAGSFARLQQRGFGFDPDAVLMMNVRLTGSATGLDDRSARYRRILDAVNAMSQVTSAADANVTTLTPGHMTSTVSRADEPVPAGEQRVLALNVTPRWFATMGIGIRAGRDYTWQDENADVIVINQSLSRQFFGDENPVGQRLRAGRRTQTVIGVVDDAVYRSGREGAVPTAYLLSTLGYGILSIRPANGDRGGLRDAVIEAITGVDPQVRVRATPLADFARATVATERLTAALAGFFGALALGLSAIGIYGVMTYAVSRRTVELAIRRALGATSADLTSRVLGRSFAIVAAGVMTGTIASVWLTPVLAPLLYGVEPRDVTTFLAAAAVLSLVALAASWLPARRAARLSPALLLRDG